MILNSGSFPPLGQIFIINTFLLSGIIFFLISTWTFQHWNNRAARIFTMLMISAGYYSLGYYFELKSSDFQEFLFWLKIKYIGLPFIPFLWLLFIIQFTDRDRFIKAYLYPVFFVIPLTTLLLILLGPSTEFYYSSLEVIHVNGLTLPEIKPGPWAIVHFIISTAAVFLGIVILLSDAIKSNTYIKIRYFILLSGVIVPWGASIVYLTGFSPGGIDLTPFALIFTAIVIVIELSQLRLFNVIPLARTRVFEVINHGIVVIDQNNNIIDVNPWAKTNLGISEEFIGTSIYNIYPEINLSLKQLQEGHLQTFEFYWQQESSSSKCFEVWHRKLTSKGNRLLGGIFTFDDITLRKQNQEALSNERILLRTLIDNIPMSVYVKDPVGRKILANKTDLLFMGLENESDAIGKTDFDIYPTKVAANFNADDREVLENGMPVLDKEELLNHKNGNEYWLLTSKVPFKDNKGKTLGVLGIGRDITEKKKMQKDLADSEERFRTLTETTSAAVFIFQSEKYIYLNPATEKLTGYSLEEMKEMNFWDIVHPDYKDFVRQKGFLRLSGNKTTRRFEFKIITKDGSEKWIDYSSGITLYKGKLAAIGTSFDITERKMAEEALSLSEQRYRKIFENSNTGILQLYPHGEIVNANNAFAQLLGLKSASDLLNEKASILQKLFTNTADRNYFFSQITEKNVVNNFEFESRNPEGTKIWINVNAWKNKELDQNSYLIESFFQDITDRRLSIEYQNEIEIARKSSEAKNQFLANMSHEIRTPVTGIIGMADVLSKTPLSHQQSDYLNTIEESSQKLLNIINEILDISKIEAGKMDLRMEPFNIREMFGSLKNMFEPIARRKNLLLEINQLPQVPVWLNGDKKRIEQILMNLISNALKFTHKGRVSVTISSQQTGSCCHKIQFEVKDSGMGIKLADREKLFQKFTQLDNSLTRVSEGTGLGLFICKELVKLMKGEINVESSPGNGSTFWFYIHLKETNRQDVENNLHSKKNQLPSTGLNILVVDDKLVNQKVLSLMLAGEGCVVDIASNGQEALDKFEPNRHDLIFMDIMMPVMDGVSAMKQLRLNSDPTPPIVALTANAMEGDAQAYIDSGFNDYLSKPVSRNDLQNMLIKWTSVSENLE